ncbi:19830_t:CDS:2, partial [Rhizophagus irregularis]
DKDHYVNFQTAYQSGTTEQYRPILMTTMANSEHIRYLYSKRVLSAEDKIACQIAIDDWDYSFKSPFVLEDNILYNNIFVREKISCE